ncbi:MAG: BrnT family toxin [Geminicoccaceae bacterium]
MMPQFTWDPEKAAANRRAHGVSFEVASRVWLDPLHVILPDRWQDGEERWHAVGLVGAAAVLLVVHTYLDDSGHLIRIISARRATAHERRNYEEA